MPVFKPYFQKHIFLPQDHGSWVFVFTPILAGLALSGDFTLAKLPIIGAAIAFFLARQPLTVIVKVFAGRRERHDLTPALVWAMVYGCLLLAALIGLWVLGQAYVLQVMIVPALAMLAWQFWMLAQRAERKQRTFEVLSTGLLAFIAPAILWAGGTPFTREGLLLWLLLFLQAGASIYYAYTRLDQRGWRVLPQRSVVLAGSYGTIAFSVFNLLLVAGLGWLGWVGPWLWAAFLPLLLEGMYATLKPVIGAKPTEIGFRATALSVVFLGMLVWLW